MRASHPCGTRDGYWRESLDDARLYRKRGAAQNVVKKLVRFGVVDAQVRKLEIRVVDDE